MAMKDDFHLVPFDHGEDPNQPVTGTVGHRTAIWSRIFKAGSLVVAAAVIAFALVVEDPRVLLADATAFVASLSAPQDGNRQETPIVRSSAETAAAPSMAGVAPTNGDSGAPSQAADQGQTDTAQAPTQALLGQFQAWAAGQTVQADTQPVEPVQQAKRDPVEGDPAKSDPVQTDPAQPDSSRASAVQEAKTDPGKTDPVKVDLAQADLVDEARAEIRPAQHRRLLRHAKIVRAETRAKPTHRAKLQREQEARAQDARAQAQRPQDPRTQVPRQQDARMYYRPAQAREPDSSVQNARPPSFLESIGLGSREQ